MLVIPQIPLQSGSEPSPKIKLEIKRKHRSVLIHNGKLNMKYPIKLLFSCTLKLTGYFCFADDSPGIKTVAELFGRHEL